MISNYFIIYIFSLAITSLINSYCNFKLCLVGSVATSGVGSSVRTLTKFFIGNNLLLKFLQTSYLSLNKNLKWFK